ncbi:MAG: translation initiation factor IF-3 [Neisseriaceae bacterium]|nr:translation initiation factor IF-3 [Neisseriaceae bacterium PsAf]MCV2502574.1 translation initiation factor IF-3 [Neisseriaceae bacterium]MCV2508911.1 translation initiation factor IF-3 [Neisseriaceae bacterium]
MAQEKKTRVNDEITAKNVRLIDENGQQIGVVPISEALNAAYDAGLDLVEISPTAKPPVCKIIDFGKFKYEQAKRLDEAKKKQKQIQIKEIKFRPSTDEGDYAVKVRNIRRFINDGNKVKVTLRFRGREMAHQQLGLQLLERVKDELQDEITVEQFPKLEGRQMVMMIAPQKKK